MTLPRGCEVRESLPPNRPCIRGALREHRSTIVTVLLAALCAVSIIAVAYESGHLVGYREGRIARIAAHDRLLECMETLELARESFAECHDLAQRLKKLPLSRQRHVAATRAAPICTNCGGE